MIVDVGKSLQKRGFLEDGNTDDLENFVEASAQIELLLHNRDEQVDGYRDPDLSLQRVWGGSVEHLDAQMLFDPFEEQFDLPAAAIKLGDGRRRQGKVVRQEDETFVVFGIEETSAAEPVRIGLS